MYFIQPKEIGELEAAIDAVQQSENPLCLLIVRGLPGMGKSHLGGLMASRYGGIQHESDQKFTTAGEYAFDASRLQTAHEMTRNDVRQSMAQGVPLVVMSNTSTERWEYEPYVRIASYYGYTVIVYDLYLQTLKYMKSSLPLLNQTKHNVEVLRDDYLRFLFENNVHSVPMDKITQMSNRFQFQTEVIQVIAPVPVGGAEGESDTSAAGPQQRFLEVFDSGYYLSLALNVAEDFTHEHSAVFWACILASHELMRVFGIASAYQMIRKLVQRNLKSHSIRKKEKDGKKDDCEEESAWDRASLRKLIKQNAGWAKYHITVLSPPEYDLLKKKNLLAPFIEKLSLLHLDEINDQFRYVLDAVGASEDNVDLSALPAYQQLMQRMGMLQGEILDKSVAPAPLSEFSATLLNTYNCTWRPEAVEKDVEETTADNDKEKEKEKEANDNGDSMESTPAEDNNNKPRQLSKSSVAALEQSSTFYLLLDKGKGVLRDVDTLRKECGVALNTEWLPHITLAFTHNDVHEKKGLGEVRTRISGLITFERFKQFAFRKRVQMADRDYDVEFRRRYFSPREAPNTDLEEDAPYPLLAELAVHSEVQMSFSTAFGFTVCDVKIRKGPFGDDESYRSHAVLLKLLPRGMVFVQHERSHIIYRGLFSLKKFYGKEGMEDDGFGMSAGELNFKLQHQMKNTHSVVLMEKVNGRAGSCRFFSFENDIFVIVGTKLAHTVGKLDTEQKRIVLTDEYPAFTVISKPSESVKLQEAQESPVVDEDGEATVENEDAEKENDDFDFEKVEFNRHKLIASNARALSLSIIWEELPQLLEWCGGFTINAEVLDPDEMHLVVIDQLQWVVLCLTQFPWEELSVENKQKAEKMDDSTGTATVTAAVGDGDAEADRLSLLECTRDFAKFFRFVPSYVEHTFSTMMVGDNEQAVLAQKVETTMKVAQSVIFERCSEGKVLYLLDQHGEVLEMMKYKTWWYIYRRSIREVVSKLLNRYFSKEEPATKTGNSNSGNESVERLETIVKSMSSAVNKEKDVAFQKKLEEFKRKLEELQIAYQQKPSERRPLQPLVDEILLEIQRRWPNKFQFLKNEMPDVYDSKVAMAISLAQSFVKYMQSLLVVNERQTVMRFRTQYPLVWEEFISQEKIAEDV